MEPKRKVGVAQLRQELPIVLEDVQNGGKGVVVMRHAEVVAEIVPASRNELLPQIIGLVSLKGGVGKTTLTMHLAAVLAKEGQKVVVLDSDDEQSALRWAQAAEQNDGSPLPFQVQIGLRDGLIRQARDLAKAGYTVLIDTPPNSREILKTVAMVADLVLVPMLPTGVDIDRVAPTLLLLEDIEAVRQNLSYALVLNRFDARTNLSKDVLAEIETRAHLKTHFPVRTSYAAAFGTRPTTLDASQAMWDEIKVAFGGE